MVLVPARPAGIALTGVQAHGTKKKATHGVGGAVRALEMAGGCISHQPRR